MSLIIGCSCDGGNGNTGLPNCSEQFGLAIGLGIQNMIASDGVANTYDLTATLGTTFVDSLTESDKSKRMFPIIDIRNVDFPKEDTQYVTDNAGQKEEVREGIQSFIAEKWKVPAGFDLKLKQMKCNRNGAWIYTRSGAVGIKKSDYSTAGSETHVWSPIEITSFAPDWRPQTATDVAKEMIPFDFNATVAIGELWMVTWSDLGTTYEAMLGLQDANFTQEAAPVVNVGDTDLEYRITSDYGSGLMNTQTVDGLVLADFLLFNNTTALAVTITGLTEVADDKYDISYASETATNSMTLSVLTSTGYEGSITYVEPA